MKLHQIPRESKIKCKVKDPRRGNVPGVVVFHHLDGMYSYCTVEKPRRMEGDVVHLHSMSELTKLDDGTYKLD